VLLLLVASLGGLLNTYLIFRLPCSTGYADSSVLRILAAVDLVLLYVLLVTRIPPVFLDFQFISHILPHILLYVPAVEKGMITLVSFFFLIFIGGRHLRQIEKKTYKCVNTFIFSIVIAFAVAVPAVFETEIKEMSREAIEGNVTVLDKEMRLSDSNLVIIHTEVYFDNTYKDMFRMLFNFLTSQVAVIWLLPVLFLHSRNVYQLNKKRRNSRDLLTPVLSIFFILFSIPQLAVFLIHILLYQPPDLLVRISGLCLAAIAAFKVALYLVFDKHLRRDLSLISLCQRRIAVPRDDF